MTAATKKKSAQLKVIPGGKGKPADLFQLLFEEANDAILLVDYDTHKILSANRRLQDLSGYLRSELEGIEVSKLFPAEDGENVKQVRSTLFSWDLLDHSGFYEDMVLLRKDGYLAFATLSVNRITAEQTGNNNVAFCILHDMGEKKSMERDLLEKHWELRSAFEELKRAHMELKSAQEALVQAGKLAALGELAAGVAHELNQPLSGIMGFGQELERVLKDQNANAVSLDYINEVVRNAVRMKKIIQQLREFTRKSVEDFQDIEIHSVIDDSLRLLDQQFKSRGIDVSIKIEDAIPKVYCNPFQLEQVFINLATNARDAIEANDAGSGKIDIEVRRKPGDPNRFLEIQFKDDGCGMTPETKNRAFDPFYTTKEVGKGTGLGLSVSYGILSKIHGSMMIESVPGKGTTFSITIPVDYRNLNSQEPK